MDDRIPTLTYCVQIDHMTQDNTIWHHFPDILVVKSNYNDSIPNMPPNNV